MGLGLGIGTTPIARELLTDVGAGIDTGLARGPKGVLVLRQVRLQN
jgi:hypothetical protein